MKPPGIELAAADRRLLRQAREDAGYARATLADALGLSVQQIKQVETGRKRPSVETLAAWCWALNLPLRVSIGGRRGND